MRNYFVIIAYKENSSTPHQIFLMDSFDKAHIKRNQLRNEALNFKVYPVLMNHRHGVLINGEE